MSDTKTPLYKGKNLEKLIQGTKLLNHTKKGLYLHFLVSQLTNFGGHVRRRYFRAGGQDINEVPDAGTYNLESMSDVTGSTVQNWLGIFKGTIPKLIKEYE
jgi:hypothetical protein